MSIFMSLSVERIHVESYPFWPLGTKRLVVVVSSPDLDGDTRSIPDSSGDTLIAEGVDPDLDHVVFRAELRRTQLTAFIEAILDGSRPVSKPRRVGTDSGMNTTTVRLDSAPVSNAVIVPDPGPGNGGPGAVAAAIVAAIASANANATARQAGNAASASLAAAAAASLAAEASMDVAIS